MARYSLLVLKVPLNPKQTYKQLSRFGIVVGISKYRDIGSVFSVFHFASMQHVQILKFCFRVSSRILTKDGMEPTYPRSSAAGTIRGLHKPRLTGGRRGSELSSLYASNAEELSP